MILAFGVLNMVLLAWQLFTGLHIIRVPASLHRKTGIALVASATIHALTALLARLL
ncbi:MAG: hypothetical protein ACQET7_11985 [Thermodesulfobacteriota bacterium]